MGGNAIKSSQRISLEEFQTYCAELKIIFPELKMAIVKSYRQKKDFGDIDIIVQKIPMFDIKQLVKDRLNPSEIYDNNMFFSFLYKKAQVDFILTPEDEFQNTDDYFGNGDLFNFLGRTARSLNFKLAHNGFYYEEHLDDHYKITTLVSKDTQKILEFLGYDYNLWKAGFDTIEEILAYGASSTLFNSLYFTLEDQSHNDRVRNKKRKMYQNMLQYIIDNNIEPKPKLTPEERQKFYDKAVQVFGAKFDNEVKEARAKYEIHKQFKALFNGDIVNHITGFEGKSLGKCMKAIHDKYPNLKEIVLLGGSDIVYDIVESMKDKILDVVKELP